MAGRISARDIEEIKARTNIADVVGGYVSLKQASAGSLKGLCPFHQEKSPSFNVRPLQGFYHCFGCGAGGDVYKFLQEIEAISFYEAVENLAGKIGYQISYQAGAAPDSGLRARILEANSLAAKYFKEQLFSDAAAEAISFLKARGFDKGAAESYGLGFAPRGWNNLTDQLKAAGFTEDELVLASLSSRGDRGVYDKFRGRLIWPIRDTANQVIGFGARKLFEDDQGPKYLNTAETAVYHKSSVLYGLDIAKKAISKQQQVVIVEGYTDVMACHLAGVETAVASCGTAFGDEHIRILNRLLSGAADTPAEVIFTFDPDEAGQKAAMRAYGDSDKFAANSYIAIGPDGLDPCDLRVKKGDQAVLEMIRARKPIHEFAIRQKIKNFDLASIEGRVGAAKAAAAVIAAIKDPTMRSEYLREVANWVNLDLQELSGLVDRASKEQVASRVESLRVTPPQQSQSVPAADYRDPTVRFEKQLLEVLIQHPDRVSDDNFETLTGGEFLAPVHGLLAEAMAKLGSHRKPTWLAELASLLADEYHPLLRELAATELPASNEEQLQKYLQGVVNAGLINLLAREKLTLQASLRQLSTDENEKAKQLQQRLVEIEKRRRELSGG